MRIKCKFGFSFSVLGRLRSRRKEEFGDFSVGSGPTEVLAGVSETFSRSSVSVSAEKVSASGSFFRISSLAAVHKHSQSLTHRVGPSHHKTLSRLSLGGCECVRECVCACRSHLLLRLSPSHSRLNFKVKEVAAHAWMGQMRLGHVTRLSSTGGPHKNGGSKNGRPSLGTILTDFK